MVSDATMEEEKQEETKFETSEEKVTEAEEHKTKGNDLFKGKIYNVLDAKFQDAVDEYTKAIEINLGGRKGAVYYTN